MNSMSNNDELEIEGKEIIHSLYDCGMIKTWYKDKPEGWRLVSGIWSPFYIQLRPLSSYPNVLRKVGHSLGKIIKNKIGPHAKCIGMGMAGIPIAIAISITEGLPSGYTRKLEGVKNIHDFRMVIGQYGDHSLVEGVFNNGDEIVLIDDLVTKFDSKLIAIEQIKFEFKRLNLNNYSLKNVVILLDREQGAEEIAFLNGIKLHSLIPFKSKGMSWLSEHMSKIEYDTISEYLMKPEKFQNERVQLDLKKIAMAK
jgi:uridine monophosphate synthetase